MTIARSVIGALDVVLGAPSLFLQGRRDAAVILLYHRVGRFDASAYPPLSPKLFDRHCRFIRRHFVVLPLRELIDRRREGRSLRRCCAVTFDDGYRDFLDFACPILERHGIPVTHFLVSSSVQSGRPNWTFRLARISSALTGSGGVELRAGQAFDLETVTRDLADRTADARDAWLARWERQLPANTPEPAMLTRDDVLQCPQNLVEWGSHTVSHAMLGRCADDVVRDELSGSREALSDMLGREIDLVAYPSGSHAPHVLRIAERCGYVAGFAVGQRETKPSDPLFALPRFDVGAMPDSMLRLEIGGAIEPLRRLRWRLARPAA